MSNVYEICFYGGLILAIVFLILSIILFIVLKIPKVFGELTGRAAKKGIKEKQQGSTPDTSVSKKEQAKYYNQNTGKIKVRDTISQDTRESNRDNTTDNLVQDKEQENKPVFTPQFDSDETAVLGASPELDNQIAKAGMDADDDEDTVVLKSDNGEYVPDSIKVDSDDEDATDVLRTNEDEDATDVLKSDKDEDATDVLKSDKDEDATDVLKSNEDEDATDVLKSDKDEDATDVLRSNVDEDATDVLRGEQLEAGDSTTVLASNKTLQLAHKVKVIYNFVVVNTSESI